MKPAPQPPDTAPKAVATGAGALPRRGLRLCPLCRALENYSWKDARADVKAGLNVALLDFPQSMAYALIAGLPVLCGLLGSAIASVVGPFFASSRFVMLGPTNSTAVLLLSSLLSVGLPPDQWVSSLPLLLAMIAAILLLGGLVGAASFVQYISRSVLTGYITAAALLIVVNQIPAVCGFRAEHASTFAQTLAENISHWKEIQWPALCIAAVTCAIFVLGKRFCPKAPLAVLSVGIATALAAAARAWQPTGFTYESLHALSLGEIAWTWPSFSLEQFSQLASPAFAVAFLCLLESVSIAKNLAARNGERFNPNQQMYSLGMANLANAIGGGMPASGSLTRSTLNWSSGARTGVSSIFSGLLLLLGIFALGPLLSHVPRAALSALIIAIGVSLLSPRDIRTAVRSTRSDAISFSLTFLGGLFFPLDTAIYLGAAASILLFLKKASTPELVEIGFNDAGELAEKTPDGKIPLRDTLDISIVHVEGDLFFGSSDLFLDQARVLVSDPNKRVIILRLRNARNLDATCALAIIDLVKFARSMDRHVLISGATPAVERVLRNTGALKVIGKENFFPQIAGNPNIATRNALLRAQQILGRDEANIVIFAKPKAEEKPATTAPSP